ncbi:YrhB domain-containing protein [Methylomonas methanica]|uniref:Immunity protein 35 domain-containing protein n=1 Tax=Methylomonas methanica (strain DSM 25384 / MC09) TaxID=857087 RepID=F9ZWM0_METMM|nr:YrhB domain-containing protein [Methylomonas methanica]AEG00867.1 hypothetical protein Metme_2469 [Methylomonas methanica MC09]
MITREQAEELVSKQVCGPHEWLPPDDEIVLVDSATIERSWGWVFFYTSRKWSETGDIQYALAGNAPVIVERDTAKLIETGTAYSAEHYIDRYELTDDPHA